MGHRHFILNLQDGDRSAAAARLRAKRWALDRDERHCSALARGDLVLIHVGRPRCGFVGQAELATGYQAWPAPAGAARGGVALTAGQTWPRTIALDAVVARIDPTGTNPIVQANAKGFASGLVLITASEYAAVVALARGEVQT